MRVSLALVLAGGLFGQAAGFKHMVACGRKGGCKNEKAFCSASSEKHEVRCCADNRPRGRKGKKFKKKFRSCKVWGASNIPNCVHAATYDEAEKICKKMDARLCTSAEMEANCTKHTGCRHDHDMIWTSDTCGQPAVPVAPAAVAGPPGPRGPKGDKGPRGPPGPADEHRLDQRITKNYDRIKAEERSVDGNQKEIETIRHDIEDIRDELDALHGMDTAFVAAPVKHKAACGRGSGNTCTEADTCAEGSEEHEVRCCSETKPKEGRWNWRRKCGIYAASKVPDCFHAKSFAEAEQICNNVGARLCTADELAKDCLKWTGCGHDLDLVWTGDAC